MISPAPKTKFEPIQSKAGAEWFVRVLLPNGERPHLGGFKTEAEAVEWIKKKSAEWLKGYDGGRFI